MKLPNQKCLIQFMYEKEMDKTLQLERLGTVGIKSDVKN